MTEKLKPVIEYYDNGMIKYAYRVDENGIEQGPYETYHENGRLWEKSPIRTGHTTVRMNCIGVMVGWRKNAPIRTGTLIRRTNRQLIHFSRTENFKIT